MRLPCRILLSVIGLWALHPAIAHAGMPSIQLTDIARMRVETISFFLFGFFLSAGLIKLLWNRLAKDFTFLPRLGFGTALGVVFLWGMLFLLVLTMISGARELMTPGAWKKEGATYRLAEPPAAYSPDKGLDKDLERKREMKLGGLRAALWKYAETHKGKFPARDATIEIADRVWQTPDPSEIRYIYLGGSITNLPARPLALEPEIYGEYRLVLFSSGEIRSLDGDALRKAIHPEKP